MDMKPTSFFNRARRSDGASTRTALLKAAGQLFAEVGYAAATNRAISDQAGTNTAAIAYYFGGKDGLYEAVLIEAHRQFIDLDTLKAITASALPPEKKLVTAMKLLADRSRRSSELWGMAVLLRELIQATDFPPSSLFEEIFPKVVELRKLVQEATGFAPDSPEGRHAASFMAMPCLALMLFPQKVTQLILPEFRDNPEQFDKYFTTYVLGGLRSMREASSDFSLKPDELRKDIP